MRSDQPKELKISKNKYVQYNRLSLDRPPQRKRQRRDVDDELELNTPTEYERYTRAKITYDVVAAERNPLAWWWSNRKDYPILSRMAFDILSIPSMSAEIERAFSQAKKLITDERNRLGEETVTACECQKQWLVVGLVGDAATRGVADALEEQNEMRPFDDLYDATSDESEAPPIQDRVDDRMRYH